ncbi:hypothetical protein BKA62DRAFT_668799 [Auriculariales sp. MPI-PUGE-AT-0066]|nr:hypothetical protein BKA62DRAFT_668799 [Auriculariales sp. MPI-PUGE-AT-0066]
MQDGISLLSLKHHLALSYLQSLTLLACRRVAGDASVSERTSPTAKFSSTTREARGDQAGDLVDILDESCIVLDKTKILEGRMKYQIDKLVRLAEQDETNVEEDPLVFRPNPNSLAAPDAGDEAAGRDDGAGNERSGVYRPPKLAPMPYIEPTGKDRSTRDQRARVPAALAALGRLDGAAPVLESTSGIGAKASMDSRRARELDHMNRFEEDNMTRLVLGKKDSKRRKRDEEHIALGGRGEAVGKRRGGGLEDDFADLLRSGGGRKKKGKSTPVLGDGYEELRERGRKQSVLSRSRSRAESFDSGPSTGEKRKASRFERDVKASKRRRF